MRSIRQKRDLMVTGLFLDYYLLSRGETNFIYIVSLRLAHLSLKFAFQFGQFRADLLKFAFNCVEALALFRIPSIQVTDP